MGKKWGKFPYETHVRLSERAERALSELAALEGRPSAAIIREVLDRHLETALPAARRAQHVQKVQPTGCAAPRDVQVLGEGLVRSAALWAEASPTEGEAAS